MDLRGNRNRANRTTYSNAIWICILLIEITTYATSAQNWQLINPKYPVNDDIVAAYSVADAGATGDGVTDVTSIFQSRLDALGLLGGGVLFVPEGKYVFKGTLEIPRGVTLRGEWKRPVKGEPIQGTILMVYSGRGDENAKAFITLTSSTAVMDMAFWYPEQRADHITPYPPTILIGHPNHWGNDFGNVKNVTLINSFDGVILSRVNGGGCPVIFNIYGTPLSRGVEIDNLGDVGRLDGIYFSPDYWAGSGLPNAPAVDGPHKGWIYQHGTGIVMRLNAWSYTCNVDIEGYAIGFHAAESVVSEGSKPNGHHYAMHYEGCQTGVHIEAADDVGIMFARVSTHDCNTAFGVGPYTSGVVQLHTCQLDAIENAVHIDPTSRTKFSLLQSDVQRGIVLIEGGTLTATDCDFRNVAPQVAFKKTGRGILTGNRFARAKEIQNSSIMWSIIDHTPVVVEPLPGFPSDYYEARKPARLALYDAASAPYYARNNGTTDATNAIQLAMDQAAVEGGGIVFLPPGHYRVNGNLTIPTGVELKGASDLSTTPTGKGSIIDVYAGKNNPDATPFLRLSPGSGVRGFTFDYPEQKSSLLPNPIAYPYCIQGMGSDVYIINVGIRATYRGVDLFTYKCDNHYVDFLTGHALQTVIRVGGGSTHGKISNLQFNAMVFGCGGESKWGSWSNSAPSCDQGVFDYANDQLDFMILGNCKNQLLYNDFAVVLNNGLTLQADNDGSPTGTSVGFGIDGSLTAMKLRAVGPEGFDFINSQIVAFGPSTEYIETMPTFTSKINLFNSDYWGNPSVGILMNGGSLYLQGANFLQGSSKLGNVLSGQLTLENSFVPYTNPLLNAGGEPHLFARWSVIDAAGIDQGDCGAWVNNLSNNPSYSTAKARNRSQWYPTASVNSGSAFRAIDGLAYTRWDTQAPQEPGQWFMVNFGEQLTVNSIILDVAGSPGDSPESFELYVSDNGSDWVGPILRGRGTDVMTILDFPTTRARYIKLLQTGHKGMYWSIHELYAFGENSLVNVTGISLDTNQVSIKAGNTYALNATITPKDADNQRILWSSSNETIASVDNTGLVAGHTPGRATITAVALDGLHQVSAKVIVTWR